MTATVSRAEYDLCDCENTNLRRALAWCGPKLSIEDRRALIAMLQRPIENGGVTEDGREDDRHDLLACEKLLRKLTDHLQLAIDSKDIVPRWFQRADALCNQAREWEPKKQEPTLYELRQIFEDADRNGRSIRHAAQLDSLGRPMVRASDLVSSKSPREQGGSST